MSIAMLSASHWMQNAVNDHCPSMWPSPFGDSSSLTGLVRYWIAGLSFSNRPLHLSAPYQGKKKTSINYVNKLTTLFFLYRDTWCMFLHLVDAVGEDLSRYDDTEAWPSLFDDFVEWANDRANQNVQVNNKDDPAA